MIRQIYVATARGLKHATGAIGLLDVAERSTSPTILWLRSLLSIYDSADMVKLDVPWWTYSAITQVSRYIRAKNGQVRVLEYGSGASTIWLAKRCKEVVTVEHDAGFAEHMKPLFSRHPNIHLEVRPPRALSPSSRARSRRKGYENQSFDDYVDAADDFKGEFDVIVIDGRSRIYCLEKAIDRLAPDGLIVFDNSNRAEYRSAIANCSLLERPLRGLAPALPYASQTSILKHGAV